MQHWWQRYGVAIGAIAVATLLRIALDRYWGDSSPYIFYYPAIMLAAVFGGCGPGILATILGGLIGNILFVEPRGSFSLGPPAEVARLATYLILGLFMSFLGGALHAARGRLRQSEERFRFISDNAPELICMVDSAGRYTFTSGAYHTVLGHDPAALAGQDALTLIHPDDLTIVRHHARGGDFVFRMRHVDGSYHWFEGTAKPIHYRGEPCSLCTARDITQRKRAEEELQAAKQLLDAHMEHSPLAVIEWGPDMRLTRWSREAERVFGWKAEEVLGKTMWEFRWVYAEDTQQVSQVSRELRHGIQQFSANRNYRKDGSIVLCHWYNSTLLDEQGKFRSILSLVLDVTEQDRTQRALEEAKAVAEEASRAKDQFIAVLSHELRTPLTPALAALSLLRRDVRLPADVREDMEMVNRNIELEVRLIADLLDVSRIISGKLHLEKRPVDVAVAIREAAAVVSGDLDAKGQTLTIETPASPYLTFGDAARLQQVFWNLLRNSIKFSPARSRIAVRATLEPQDHCPLAAQPCPVGLGDCPLPLTGAGQTCSGNLIVQVIDKGSGIAPETLPRLFNAFEQDERARSFGGLGLGLSICKAVVEMHGGSISAASEGVGCGATFTVRLPVAQCPKNSAARQTPGADSDASSSIIAPHPALRILLVEDHADTAKLMTRLLMADGHEVITAASVADALAAARHAPPDVLISDLGLPDGSGFDLMRQLLERGQRIPAIALSGYGAPSDIEKSQSAGFAEHLVKPLSSVELLTAAMLRLGVHGAREKNE